MTNDQPKPLDVSGYVIDGVRQLVRAFMHEHGRTPDAAEADTLLEVAQSVVFAMAATGEDATGADLEADAEDPLRAHLFVTLAPSGRRVHFELRAVPRACRMH